MKSMLRIKLTLILTALFMALVIHSCRSVNPYWSGQKMIYSCKEDSLTMIMENRKLIIIKENTDSHDTIAICNYRSVNNELIEIGCDSKSEPYTDPIKSCTIDYDYARDSALLVFDIPNVRTPLSISVYSYPRYRTIDYTADDIARHRPVIINYGDSIGSSPKFRFEIKPYDILEVPFKSIYGINNGRVKITSREIPFIPEDKDDKRYTHHLFPKITVTLPDLTDDTFTGMLILDEFIRINDDKLYWRGMVFDRVNAQPGEI